MPIPVLPRMTAPPIQPPLGVESKILPSRSMMAMWVVPLREPDTGSESGSGPVDSPASLMFASQ
jgi:hypothetical protein